MTARHGGLAHGHGPMAMPAPLDPQPHPRPPDALDLTHASTRVGPVSVQSQVLYTGTADWLLDVPDATTDSAFNINSSATAFDRENVSTISDSQPASGPSDLSHLETTEWCNGSSHVGPWFPGSRTDPDLGVDTSLQRAWTLYPIAESLEDPNAELLVPDSLRRDVSLPDTTKSAMDFQDPNTTSPTDVTTCSRCSKQFTGQYQRGNYARHVKQQHRDVLKSLKQRTCRECDKVFKRQDARRKHEWIVHGVLDSEPCPRKGSSSHHESRQPSDADTDEARSHHKPSSLSSVSNDHEMNDLIKPCYRLPVHSEHARTVFASIYARLDIATYNSFCEAILVRWEQIVEALRLQRSDAYTPFERVLSRLSSQLRPGHSSPTNSYLNVGALTNESLNGASLKSRPVSRTDRGKGSAPMPTSSTPSKKRATSAKQLSKAAEKSRGEMVIMSAEPQGRARKSKLDCPIHKYYTMVVQQRSHQLQTQHSLKPPCGGCRQEFMSQIRHHLNSSEKHRKFFSNLRHCERCHEDVVEKSRANGVDDQTWTDGNHEAGTCIKRDEPRESRVVCWARLYLAIFPLETSVPSPYTDEWSWLPDEMVAPLLPAARRPSIIIQGPSLADQSSASFLDDQQPHQQMTPQGDVVPEESPLRQIAEAASESTILNDVNKVAAWFFAMDRAEMAPEPRSSDEIAAEYHARVEDLRWRYQVQDEANDMTNRFQEPFPSSSSPGIGHARHYSFDANTQPSTRYHRNNSFSFTTSSQTSRSLLDDVSFTNQPGPSRAVLTTIDPRNLAEPFLYSPLERAVSTPGTPMAFNKPPQETNVQRSALENNQLNVPGRSRMVPQNVERSNEEALMQYYCNMFAQSKLSPFHTSPDGEAEQAPSNMG